jgi:hypothetical protein
VLGGLVGQKNGNILSQGTTSKKPVLHLSGGQWYAQFDATDDFITKAFTLGAPMTRISAVRDTFWFSNKSVFDGGTINTAGLKYAPSTPSITMYAGSDGPTSADLASGGAAGVVTEIFNGASSKIAVNNAAYATGNTGSNTPDGLTIGTQAGGTSAASVAFYAAIVIGRVLTDAEIAKARTWAGALVGLNL